MLILICCFAFHFFPSDVLLFAILAQHVSSFTCSQLSRNYEFMIYHRSYTVVKLKLEKNSGLNGIRTHDLCDIGAVLYQLSYQAI